MCGVYVGSTRKNIYTNNNLLRIFLWYFMLKKFNSLSSASSSVKFFFWKCFFLYPLFLSPCALDCCLQFKQTF